MKLVASFVGLSVMAVSAASAQELLTNGGFETGDFTGWTAWDQGSGWGNISATNQAANTALPLSGSNAAGPSSGSWYAAVDQAGGNAYSLTQNFTVSLSATQVVVSFDMYHNDSSGAAPINSGVLDYTVTGTQWARVDILDSVGNVIATIADVGTAPWTNYSMDITGLVTLGDTYTFRYGHVDNLFFYHTALDNASVMQTVPTPGAAALLGLGAIVANRRRRR